MQVIRKREKSVDEETLLTPTTSNNAGSTSNTSQPSFKRNFSKLVLIKFVFIHNYSVDIHLIE